MGSRWWGRRNPRLSGTLHITDAGGREVAVPLRGRATVLPGLSGYAEVWAVHTTATGGDTSLMISYGRAGAAGHRSSGLCAAGETVILDGACFTWRVRGTPILRRREAAPATATGRPREGTPATATGRPHEAASTTPINRPRETASTTPINRPREAASTTPIK